MVPCSTSDRAPDHGGDAKETDAPGQMVMSTMQTQALYAVLRDFDLADSRQGLSVDEATSLRAKLGLRFPDSVTECVLQSQMFSVM